MARYPPPVRTLLALARASHLPPTVVVTALAALLAVAAGHGPGTIALLSAAVLTGQLSIGWSNDLLDEQRDRAVGRTDKPLATGALSKRTAVRALSIAVALCVVLSLALGPWAALAHLVLVSAGWSYNALLKSTVWSWVPYGLAFGALPAVPWLALRPPALPPAWMIAVGALLGVGAHLVNVLPDLADDAATGVRGLGHRLGARGSGRVAVLVLLSGTAIGVFGPVGPAPWWAWMALVAAGTVAVISVAAPRRWPFHGAMTIAVLNVVMLLARPG